MSNRRMWLQMSEEKVLGMSEKEQMKFLVAHAFDEGEARQEMRHCLFGEDGKGGLCAMVRSHTSQLNLHMLLLRGVFGLAGAIVVFIITTWIKHIAGGG